MWNGNGAGRDGVSGDDNNNYQPNGVHGGNDPYLGPPMVDESNDDDLVGLLQLGFDGNFADDSVEDSIEEFQLVDSLDDLGGIPSPFDLAPQPNFIPPCEVEMNVEIPNATDNPKLFLPNFIPPWEGNMAVKIVNLAPNNTALNTTLFVDESGQRPFVFLDWTKKQGGEAKNFCRVQLTVSRPPPEGSSIRLRLGVEEGGEWRSVERCEKHLREEEKLKEYDERMARQVLRVRKCSNGRQARLEGDPDDPHMVVEWTPGELQLAMSLCFGCRNTCRREMVAKTSDIRTLRISLECGGEVLAIGYLDFRICAYPRRDFMERKNGAKRSESSGSASPPITTGPIGEFRYWVGTNDPKHYRILNNLSKELADLDNTKTHRPDANSAVGAEPSGSGGKKRQRKGV